MVRTARPGNVDPLFGWVYPSLMNRRWLAVVLLFASAAVVGGALLWRSWATGPRGGGSNPTGDRPANVSAPAVSASATAPTAAVSAAPAATSREHEIVSLTVYFPSRRYVESGDESLPRLVSERHELEAEDAGANSETLARAAVAALKAGPKSTAATLAIPERLVIRHVNVRDGIAYVDFSRAGLSGGSLEETLLVRSLVRTLTGVPHVRAVQFLVEGKATETLMGHVTTTKPISTVD